MGGFDIYLLNYDSHISTSDFVNTLFSINVSPCLTNPTRVSREASKFIGNIFPKVIGTKITCANSFLH